MFVKYLKQPKADIFKLISGSKTNIPYFKDVAFSIETNIKYEGYIDNELDRIKNTKKLESLKIPPSFNYSSLQGLSIESKDRLNKVRPETVGQASRISGIRPTDITLIGINLQKTFHVKHDEKK